MLNFKAERTILMTCVTGDWSPGCFFVKLYKDCLVKIPSVIFGYVNAVIGSEVHFVFHASGRFNIPYFYRSFVFEL